MSSRWAPEGLVDASPGGVWETSVGSSRSPGLIGAAILEMTVLATSVAFDFRKIKWFLTCTGDG